MNAPPESNRNATPSAGEARAQSGLAGVFAQNKGQLHRFLVARTANPADVDDLLQELWIRIVSLGDNMGTGPIGNPRAYLFRMAANLVLDSVRSRQRMMARDHGWLDVQGRAQGLPHEIADPAISAEDALADAEEVQLLGEAIDALPPGARRALHLHRLQGLKQDEVARIMGISRSGVEKHLAVALRHLRAALGEAGR